MTLGRKDKDALSDLVGRGRQSAGDCWRARGADLVLATGGVVVRVERRPLRRALARDLLAFRRGRRRVVSDPAVLGGEPVFAGTRVPLAHVAAQIAKGVPLNEVAEDYPALGCGDLAFARVRARLGLDLEYPRKELLTLARGGTATLTTGGPSRPA